MGSGAEESVARDASSDATASMATEEPPAQRGGPKQAQVNPFKLPPSSPSSPQTTTTPQEELLRGAVAAGLSAEDQASLAAASGSLEVQQQAQGSNGDAVAVGAAGAAAFLEGRPRLQDRHRRPMYRRSVTL